MKRSENKKINVCVICGGVSPEHVISVASAASVAEHLDKAKYNVQVIGIGREDGEWRYYGDQKFYKEEGNIDSHRLLDNGWRRVLIKPGQKPCLFYDDKENIEPIDVDVVFPVIHGDNGEDGRLQGLIESLGYPIAGCGTLASAMGMDKDVSKLMVKGRNVQVVPWVFYNRLDQLDVDHVVQELGMPVFVKPTSSGSSCGITKAKTKEQIVSATKEAFKFSRSIIIEKAIDAREIEVAVLGRWNGDITVSVPGEIVPKREFYNYEAKYVDKDGADLLIPAEITKDQINSVKIYAEAVFRSLRCNGMARIDFFIDKNNSEVFFNEINTIPGFTIISMYPKLLGASGIPYKELLDKLVTLGLEDFNA